MRGIDLLKDRWLSKFSLHVLTGGISVLIHYGAMWILLTQDVGPLTASIFGFCAGATIRFLTAYLAVFEPAQPWGRALPRFLASLILQGACNAGLLWLLLALHFPVWIAQILVTGAMTILNFVVYRLWVFR